MAYTPLASVADLQGFGSFAELVQNSQVWTGPALASLMVRASRMIETRCNRRLAPFGTPATGSPYMESHRAYGIDSDGVAPSDMPLDMIAALGRSKALAYGALNMVRDFWLDQYAPQWPDLWTYTMDHVQLVRAYGDSEIVPAANLEGPEPDTGHFRLRLGTFCPIGTTVRVYYSGGYTGGVPDDLNTACIFQAAKLLLVGAEPELPSGMSTGEIDAEITGLLLDYVRT